jgi:hypothetical protein
MYMSYTLLWALAGLMITHAPFNRSYRMSVILENGSYKIMLSQFKILGLLGHNLITLMDSTGELISEIDGLATGKNGEIKPIGYLCSDRLKAYEFSSAYLYASTQSQVALFEADEDAVFHLWKKALAAVELINTKNLPYPILGLGKNSNSVTSTIIKCMNLTEATIPGGSFAPFAGQMVLSESEIINIQQD